MGLLEGALKFYIAERRGVPVILTPGIGGMPEIVTPTHPILRVSYLSPESAASEQAISNAKAEVQGRHPLLLMTMPCPDGPPYRSGVIFWRNQTVSINWTDGKHGKAALNAEEYLAAATLHNYSWGSDLVRGARGYFLSGPSDASTLWRIARVEFDVAGRQMFTLSPVRLASGLPDVDFSTIGDDLLRQKLVADWGDVQKCLAGNIPYGLITAAKNVAESLVLVALGKAPGKMTLEQGLTEVGKRLKDKQPLALPLDFLDYHLMSKLRILHGQCHSDRVVISGRLVEPEFALTVAADLVQVLRSAGVAR
ncbi:MAG: hypothetical protein HYS04_11030 [Acidobacteria bacterium]|nr:hypothetical protein [Acidobacteriota bacterium]